MKKNKNVEVHISKRKKSEEDEEIIYSSKLQKKSYKKLKDELGSTNLGETKKDLLNKMFNEALPYINLPRDIKSIILDYLELKISHEDLKSIEKYEKSRNNKQKPARGLINYIKMVYGYFPDQNTPFIVFKNIFLDFYLDEIHHFPQLFTNIIPFTNCQVGGRNIMEKYFYDPTFETICHKYVQGQGISTINRFLGNVVSKNVTNLSIFSPLNDLKEKKFYNIENINIGYSLFDQFDDLSNMIQPTKIRILHCNKINKKMVDFLNICPNITDLEFTELCNEFLEYLPHSKIQNLCFIYPYFQSSTETHTIAKKTMSLVKSFTYRDIYPQNMINFKDEIDVTNLETLSIFFEEKDVNQSYIIDIFDFCMKQNPLIKLVTDRNLRSSYLKSHPNVSIKKLENF